MTGSRRAFSKAVAEAELPVLLQSFRAAGYSGLQLKGAQYAPFLDDAPRALAELSADPGAYSSLIMGARLDDPGRALIMRTIDFAAGVGAERIVFCHHHTHDGVEAAQRRAFARELTAIAESAREKGVAFSLHHHTDQPVMELPDFHEFFDGLEPGVLGLTVDTAHLAQSGVEDLPAFIDTFAAHIDNVHLKDYDGAWQLLGGGQLDLDGVLTALDRNGFEGWLCVDEESETGLADSMQSSAEWLSARGR